MKYAKHPYKGYSYYEYTRGIDGRRAVVLTKHGCKNRCLLLSRYKMEVKLGKRLPSHIHVDHIDGDSTNDKLSNLQTLTARENILKSTKTGRHWVQLKCPVCDKLFDRTHSSVQNKSMPVSCSRSCGNRKTGLNLRKKSNITKHYRV